MVERYINKVINGDCIEKLSTIESDSIDICFADPPFNLEKKYSVYKDQKPDKDYFNWCRNWLQELVRVTRPSGSIFVHNIPKWLTYYAEVLNEFAFFKHWIAWDAMSNPLGKTLLPAHYGILYYTKRQKGFKFYDIRSPHKRCRVCNSYIKDYGGKKDQMHPFGALVSDVWTDIHRIRHNIRRDEHPCQLPLPLLDRIILMSTDPNDIVLDPFLGTGTTAISAKALGRNYIGIEIDPDYVKIATDKLEKVKLMTYKDYFVSLYLNRIVTIRDIDSTKLFPHQITSVEKKKLRAEIVYSNKTNAKPLVLQPRILEKSKAYKTNIKK